LAINSPRWIAKQEPVRRRVRNIFNYDGTPRSWELYIEAQREYRKEIRRVSKKDLEGPSSNELPGAARLHRALSK
jgi:hypothetical protein